MEYDGVAIATVTPRNVIREAVSAGIIGTGETWLDMLTDRNSTSHTYNFATFEAVIRNVQARYLSILNDLYLSLAEEVME